MVEGLYIPATFIISFSAQAYFRYIADSVPDNPNKVNIAIIWVK